MKTKFTYWILNYVHSQFLEEKLNVAVLFYFRDENKLVIKFPKKFKRIKDVYNDFEEWQLKSSLRAIEEKIVKLNLSNNGLFFEIKNDTNLIDEVLINDATVLRFSAPKSAVSVSQNFNDIIEKYYSLYFSEYKPEDKKVRHDEEYLLRTFKNKLLIKDSRIQNYLIKDTQVKSQKTTVKFEYEWHNGVVNLVKPISFDLEEENSINHKAILFHGQLNFIKDVVKEKNYNIDLLISAPSRDNNSLFSAYENALDILSDASVKKNIINENALEEYVDHVSEVIHLPDNFK